MSRRAVSRADIIKNIPHLSLEKFNRVVLATTFTLCTATPSLAENNRADYDLDNDGLIEINDLNDLNQIRYHLDGTALYGSSEGCPDPAAPDQVSGCFGFELTTDLDFDTNADGQLNHLDDFWNQGQGWTPIKNPRSGSPSFTAVFDGNGFAIRNLYIYASLHNGYANAYNSDRENYVGLFAHLYQAEIRNLALTGPLAHVYNPTLRAGALGGDAHSVTIKNVFSTVPVTAGYPAGLVGFSRYGTFENVFVSGALTADDSTYGVTSSNGTQVTTIKNALVTSSFNLSRYASPIGSNQAQTENSYWAAELTGVENAPATLAQLTCTEAEGAQPCSESVYQNWPLTFNDAVYWQLGDENQLPALVINGKTYRDSDGDGRLDSEDGQPLKPKVYEDADNDNAVDLWHPHCDLECQTATGLATDHMPQSAAAYLDGDLDGLPDEWAPSCDLTCQQASGLTLDEHLLDTDNDGEPNSTDSDDNQDGQPDADSSSDGLLEIHSLAQLNAMRFQTDGQGWRTSIGSELDSSGCPMKMVNGRYQQACHGFKLMTDLDFDTNGDGVLNEQDEYWNEGKGWLPIGYMSDDYVRPISDFFFQGNRKTIHNLFIDRYTKAYTGLFAYVDQGKILQLKLDGHLNRVRGGKYTGLVVGRMFDGHLQHITAKGAVMSVHANVGGLVGGMDATYLRNSSVEADVTGASSVGGLVGNAASSGNTMSECHFKGSVDGTSGVGGLLGIGQSIIDFCDSDALLNGDNSVGGLVGRAEGSNEPLVNGTYITNSVARGRVFGHKKLGGIIGENFLGSVLDGVVTTVDVEAEADTTDNEWGSQIGGAIGYDHSAELSNVYVLGSVVGRDKVGGLLGETVHRNVTISNALVLGKITLLTEPALNDGNGTVGGILGTPYFTGSITSTYWATDSTGVNHSGFDADTYGNEYGLTLAQLSCPTQANNTTCAGITLFENWEADENQNRHWEFGSNQKLPRLALGTTTYADLDFDGHLDHEDQFPENPARYLDSDGDGYDDAWPKYCDWDCRQDSGRRLDQMPNHAAASIDADGDGRPDAFNDDCNSQCQLNSGLVLDEYLNDVDNDGVPDNKDPNNEQDNGVPTIVVSNEHFNISVDNEKGTEGKLIFDQAFMDRFTIHDAVDSNPNFYLLGVKGEQRPRYQQINLGDHVVLPSGRQELAWGVEDDSGNQSEVVMTFVNVYPRLQFKQPDSTVAERSDATIEIVPTAAMPVVQVTVMLSIDTQSTTLLPSDLNEFGFPLDGSERLPVEIKQYQGDDDVFYWTGALNVPLVQDGTGEPDKQLAVALHSMAHDSAGQGVIEFTPNGKTHTLTVFDGNLPPEVTLTLTQAGQLIQGVSQGVPQSANQEPAKVNRKQGLVTVTATAVEPNVHDQIASIKWDSSHTAWAEKADQQLTWTFDPSELKGGDYWIQFTAIDDHQVPQSGIAKIEFSVDSAPDPDQRQTGSSSNSGGGAIYGWLMLIALAFVTRRRLREVL